MSSTSSNRGATKPGSFGENNASYNQPLMGDMTDDSSSSKHKLSQSRNVALRSLDMPDMPQTPTRNDSTASSPLTQAAQQGQSKPAGRVNIRIFLPNLIEEDDDNNSSDEAQNTNTDCNGVQFEIVDRSIADCEYLITRLMEHYNVDPFMPRNAFSLWMVSPLLELQMKDYHCPLDIRCGWQTLLRRFLDDQVSEEEMKADEPAIFFKRNVALSIEEENKIITCDHALDILFYDARTSVLSGKYTMDVSHAAEIAGLGFAIQQDKDQEITTEFIRKHLESQLPDFLADRIRGPMILGKTLSSATHLKTVEDYWKKRDKDSSSLKREYLQILKEHCPMYGAAFFTGTIEKPKTGPLKTLRRFVKMKKTVNITVSVAINRNSITIIDTEDHEVLLCQNIIDCSWRKLGSESSEDVPQSMLLLFPDNTDTSLLQIFGPQTIFMTSILTAMKDFHTPSSPLGSDKSGNSVESTSSINKYDRMCLASFNEQGQCVKSSGSLKKVNWTGDGVRAC